ncbi:hypothetical protein NHQ30_003394 [Ciborinia camelliae]|nr:hypothetical protein NHQ30_003394 [Ciborinia camelliae]
MAAPNVPLSKFTGRQKNSFPPPSISETTEMLNDLCSELDTFAKDPKYSFSKHGGNNNIVVFTCLPFASKYRKQRISCVLRTAKYYDFSKQRQYFVDQSIKMLVALTRQFGKSGAGLQIPGVLAYDSTFENCIKSPYIIQEWVEGTTLLMKYRTMNASLLHQRGPNHNPRLLERRQVARKIAQFIAARERQTFLGYGVIKNASDMPSDDHNVLAARFTLAVAPTRIAGTPIPTKLDFSHFISELSFTRLVKKSSSNDDGIKNARKLVNMSKNMSEKGLLTGQPSVLWHPDFHPRNIIIQSDASGTDLKGVIDWDNSMALPRIMTRGPPSFLWKDCPTRLSQLESDAIKNAFDETIERLVPGYREDAYSLDRVLVRALGMYALFGSKYPHYHELSFEKLIQECEARFPGQKEIPD